MFEKVDGMMATYLDAVEEFSQSAKEFLKHVHRYQEAAAASAELRRVLDNGDDALSMLMTELEQAFSVPFAREVMGERASAGGVQDPAAGSTPLPAGDQAPSSLKEQRESQGSVVKDFGVEEGLPADDTVNVSQLLAGRATGSLAAVFKAFQRRG
jgi:hypothetical protein